MANYQTADPTWFDKNALEDVSRDEAAPLLAFVATTSLAYGPFGSPRKSYTKAASEALGDFGPEAKFLTNTADWIRSSSVTVRTPPLGDSTFEAGILGYDANLAFVYWVEEED